MESGRPLPILENGKISFTNIFDEFHDGVTITDAEGNIIYYNKTQAQIDDLDLEFAIGKKLTAIYLVDEETTPMMTCLRNQKAIKNLNCVYRTNQGKEIYSTHNIFPLFASDRLVGGICFVKAYNINEQTFFTSAKGRSKESKKNSHLPPRNRKENYANGTRFNFTDIIGLNAQLGRAMETARLAAQSGSPVLLLGETGTGKELFAQSIHNNSPRKMDQFVAVNCTAIPENLLEATLFGTAKGAFTGAINKPGLLEMAHNGTLFLDEINSMAIGLQAKLLRVLQERKVRRVGSLDEKEIDVKIISSINVPPHHAIDSESMRPDLLYRLAVIFIRIPPLRERMDDLPLLIDHFIHKCNTVLKKKVKGVSPEMNDLLKRYHWPGNVRELEHVIEGAINLVEDQEVICMEHLSFHISRLNREIQRFNAQMATEKDEAPFTRPFEYIDRLPGKSKGMPAAKKSLPEIQSHNEVESIHGALTASRGNAAKAARRLGISPQLLNYKMKKYLIDLKKFKNNGLETREIPPR